MLATPDLPTRILRARELLRTARHAAMATVNEDGSPHNTPFLFLRSSDLTQIYWGSHPGSQHSQNILRTGQMFVVIYDIAERGGIFMQTERGRIAENDEFTTALAAHNALRSRENKPPLAPSYYAPESSQKMWVADVTQLWINSSERDANGLIIKDFREPVTAGQLLQ